MQVLYKYMRMELEQYAAFKENIVNIQSEIEIKNEVQFNYSKEFRIMSCRNSVTYQQNGKPIMKVDMRSDFVIEEKSASSLVQEVRWYNDKRIKLRLKGMSPVQYRAHYLEINS